MSVHDEVVKLLNHNSRVQEGVIEEAGADITNLRAAVQELQATVIYLADEIDRRDLAAS